MRLTLRVKAALWLSLCSLCVLINYASFRRLWAFSITNEFSTHILLMPLMSGVLIFRKRSYISPAGKISLLGLLPVGLGLAMAIAFAGSANLSLTAFGIVWVWLGGFLLLFGFENFRTLLFPLLCLFFMVPIPQSALQAIVTSLQKGSALGVSLLFRLTGTPFLRNDFSFSLPGLNIEIAPQCSSIRSSLALLISSLLAAHLVLRSNWRKFVFVIVAVPMAMLKNAIRICVISLLAVHLDKRWLTESDLHRNGGILFFILALLLLFPVLLLLKKSEKRHELTRNK
jgi:exosortase